ncbi:Trypanosomal VSG domain containing protein, putative [Trypanosoma equiperdum]|uniref:Trypanosomal VSG domain containing protein, putative n=1 Tax=Trypanosoma equiperdum TaxID=5694 RepID=A0A1G4I0F8_TRYEQ|nr:Trypanosomal VSG domain containing protein, putative [Trypanosoma equiperdum]
MQSKLSTLPAAQTFFLLRLAITLHVSDATIETGDNGAYYAAACSIVNMLEAATKIAGDANAVDSLLGDINAINLSAAEPAFKMLINHDKDWADSAAKKEAGTKRFASDWEKRYGSWREAAVKIKNNEAAYSEFKREKISTAAKKTVTEVAVEAAKVAAAKEITDKQTKIQEMQTKAQTALYGSVTGTDDEQAPDLSDHVNSCGQTNGNGGDPSRGESTNGPRLYVREGRRRHRQILLRRLRRRRRHSMANSSRQPNYLKSTQATLRKPLPDNSTDHSDINNSRSALSLFKLKSTGK